MEISEAFGEYPRERNSHMSDIILGRFTNLKLCDLDNSLR